MRTRNPALHAFAEHIRTLARTRTAYGDDAVSPESLAPDDSQTHQRYRNWYRSTTT